MVESTFVPAATLPTHYEIEVNVKMQLNMSTEFGYFSHA